MRDQGRLGVMAELEWRPMQPATKKEISPMTIDAIIGRDDREVELRDE